MGLFSICVTNLHWIDEEETNTSDLCLHGYAVVYIGKHRLEYDATISATALYLLKTLTENHIINTDNQMLPCCGHYIIPDKNLENVEIAGCPYGIDWSVIHYGNSVILELEDGTKEIVSIDDYRKEVFNFVDKIEAYYNSCLPREIPKNKFDQDGYTAFWNEWHRRRNM